MAKRPPYRPPLPVLRQHEEPLMSPLQLRTALAHCLGTELERCAAAARPSARGAASRGTDYAGGGREEG